MTEPHTGHPGYRSTRSYDDEVVIRIVEENKQLREMLERLLEHLDNLPTIEAQTLLYDLQRETSVVRHLPLRGGNDDAA